MTLATPEPGPDDIARTLADIERHLTAQTPHPPPDASDDDTGETKRVRQLRAEVAEARQLAALQTDDTPLLLDTPRVRRRRRKAHETARLHRLGRDPEMRAWQAARMRRILTTALMVALTLALAWSTAGVQQFAAEGAEPWSPGWIFAWLVEPFMSIALLGIVGARAYLGTQGQPLDHPKLIRIEYLFLGLTLGMNAWPYLPWTDDDFTISRLVLHILGPIVAVAIVGALPIILAAFARLDPTRETPAERGLTGLTYSANTGDRVRLISPEVAALIERTQALIAAGDLPATPSAYKIQRALRCGMDDARAVRDALAPEAA
ncbi:conjugal transfer protein TraI [Nonomuraea turkmeniaca]|uniref:Conjugal transfer protein TraI n=1 Tax=Nonomuraea turkmeniaca TaxID=103838 RepID=A0A5S4F7F6_9ACTN|nr:conjugal transfer protein TraI [Nonomuraea turkmeniaca]TMR12387.1 conjugal transfer protein TraI [Nonomuraea turkmeniaca]